MKRNEASSSMTVVEVAGFPFLRLSLSTAAAASCVLHAAFQNMDPLFFSVFFVCSPQVAANAQVLRKKKLQASDGGGGGGAAGGGCGAASGSIFNWLVKSCLKVYKLPL